MLPLRQGNLDNSWSLGVRLLGSWDLSAPKNDVTESLRENVNDVRMSARACERMFDVTSSRIPTESRTHAHTT